MACITACVSNGIWKQRLCDGGGAKFGCFDRVYGDSYRGENRASYDFSGR